MIGTAPVVLVVAADSPFKTAAAFLDAAKTDRVTVGIPGPLSVPGISLSALKEMHSLKLEGIPFTGNSNTIQALVAGEVQAAYLSADGGVTLPRIASGELIALATAVAAPTESLPDVPTLNSLGYSGLPNGDSFWFLAAPTGTAEPIMEKLETSMKTCMSDPAIQKQIGEGVAPTQFIGREAVTQMLREADEGYKDFLG
jgi:tripartite-type tricarboxylate transporter receptor subunit TctC